MRVFQLLQPDDLQAVVNQLPILKYEPGNKGVVGHAGTVKDNFQIDHSDPAMRDLSAFLASKIMDDENIFWYLFPKTLTLPIISKTVVGGGYGTHIDNSQLTDHAGAQMRTDISYTLFLSDPDTYDGGELSIQENIGTVDVKLSPGEVVFYGSGRLHEVKPVTRGERIVCIGWIESMIYDEEARTALYDMRAMQEEVGNLVDKASPTFQNFQAAVNKMRRCLMGRI